MIKFAHSSSSYTWSDMKRLILNFISFQLLEIFNKLFHAYYPTACTYNLIRSFIKYPFISLLFHMYAYNGFPDIYGFLTIYYPISPMSVFDYFVQYFDYRYHLHFPIFLNYTWPIFTDRTVTEFSCFKIYRCSIHVGIFQSFTLIQLPSCLKALASFVRV